MELDEPRPIEILLVDDNPGDVALTRRALERCKISNVLNVVADGESAIAYLKHRDGYEDAATPQLIMLDLNLPGMDGREVLEAIKSDVALRGIPVVVMTSSLAEEDIARSYDSHANCYITKPIDIEGFKRAVEAIDQFWFSIVRLPSS